MLKIANIIGLCFFIIVVCIAGCIQFDESEERYEDTRNKMETFVSIIVYSFRIVGYIIVAASMSHLRFPSLIQMEY